MRDGENIRQVAELGANYIGMIFWGKSPRNVTMIPTHAGIIPDRANSQLSTFSSQFKRVGVFVDEMPQNIITRVVNYKLDVVQMHGHEQPTVIRNLRATLDPDIRPSIQFWKAISISNRSDLEICKDYEDCVDAFVFDTKCACMGGSGQQIDWSVLADYDGEKPFLLSGGIGPDDAERIKAFHHPKCMGIDLNSRFETEPGLKDINKLKAFIQTIRS
jgi:phosphoribosylanthranilate isomerase